MKIDLAKVRASGAIIDYNNLFYMLSLSHNATFKIGGRLYVGHLHANTPAESKKIHLYIPIFDDHGIEISFSIREVNLLYVEWIKLDRESLIKQILFQLKHNTQNTMREALLLWQMKKALQCILTFHDDAELKTILKYLIWVSGQIV